MSFPLMPHSHVNFSTPVVTYRATVNSTLNQTSYSFTLVPIGPAAANRHVVVSSQTTTTGVAPTAVTINGIAAVLLIVSGGTAFFAALVPTGTTATVVFTFGASADRMTGGVWSVTGLTRPLPVSTNSATSTSIAASLTLDVPDGGYVIAALIHGTGTNMVWSGAGVVERFDATAGSSFRFSAADGKPATSGVQTITGTGTGSALWRIAAIALR